MTIPIQELIGGHIFAWLLVFARVGAAFQVMPTIGDAFVSTRVRLLFALLVSLLLTPVMMGQLPTMPGQAAELLVLLFIEITVGLFIGTVARLMLTALEIAGSIIALQAGLANATMFNPAMASQGSLPGAMLGWLGLLLIFLTDMHHLLIMAVADSYETFRAGAPLPTEDMAYTIGLMVSDSFLVGFQMSIPFTVAGIMFALALGLVARLAPQIQVFFLFMPVQVMLGLFLMAITMSAMMLFWLTHFEASLIGLLRSG